MPRNVWNFWMDADIDGRETRLSGGPVSKVGTIDVDFKIRRDGRVDDALRVRGYARSDGSLTLRVFDADNNTVYEVNSQR